MGQPVVHWELWSQDPAKVADFYAKAFDWQVNFLEEINYRLVETGGEGGINGGIMQPQQGPWPGNMAFYISVDDLDGLRQKIQDAGGKIVVERMDVPNVGAFSLFEDPDGRVMGIWQQQEQK
ncbi:MAG: VOC family protein [Gemmatimonadales bacterium]|nr:VOC family protein [Gemmatimonadales bacterium]NIN49087.1 VOC family protein [Gemmatimonadales bacterium]NIP06551.1 VOC family protein [Gemmatimonadales bacterium]NIR00248.1 VOC family protein [Gemmatimonadales bacterium]NIS64581.1 VOC family protein [Gemmatimonadales bacterium]